jgi:hypothetical protein
VAVQEVIWDKGGSEPTDDYTLSYRNGNAKHCLGIGLFIYMAIISAVKR